MFEPIIFRLAARYIRRRVLQSLLFILGVALGVALVIAIDLANNSASRAFALSTESVTGKATHQISAGSGGVPTTLYTDLRRTVGLREIAPIVQASVRVTEADNRPLRVLGVDVFAEPPFRAYLSSVEVRSETGNSFEALTRFISEPNTVLISQTLADRYAFEHSRCGWAPKPRPCALPASCSPPMRRVGRRWMTCC
jgi:putative ABC transport system permease protein